MKMMVLLLVSSAALLVSPSPRRRHNLMSIMDHARNVSVSPTEFVDNLKQQYDCEDMFFCKLHSILCKNKHFNSTEVGRKLLRNLEMFNRETSVNCAEVPKDPTPTPKKELTMPNLIKDLITCSQMRMYNPTQEPNVAQGSTV
ncbi:hypothetical protein JOB18_033714 [Solea senegalensis]|uniref:Interleukin-4 n=1 Tax=Solea senegalensis TaxID=28829 RepID=A0AAV6SG53_SOLSE|nr:hypothetical protein JOB18_033714 [Solea senegalensis]